MKEVLRNIVLMVFLLLASNELNAQTKLEIKPILGIDRVTSHLLFPGTYVTNQFGKPNFSLREEISHFPRLSSSIRLTIKEKLALELESMLGYGGTPFEYKILYDLNFLRKTKVYVGAGYINLNRFTRSHDIKYQLFGPRVEIRKGQWSSEVGFNKWKRDFLPYRASDFFNIYNYSFFIKFSRALRIKQWTR